MEVEIPSCQRFRERGLLHNLAVALGNRGSPEAVPVLAEALSGAEPLVRGSPRAP
ncbi:MAG TPA: hypothetical protein VHG28_04985 [Longimicrobiaceae bacterium]|nr:hypothetical protein [Longimicrobiaceae bacterium]